jgi:hypothetical protein
VSNKRNDPSFYPFTAVGNNLENIRNHIETYDLNRYRVSSVFSSSVFHEPPGNHTAGLGYYKLMFNIFVLNGRARSLEFSGIETRPDVKGCGFFFPKYVSRRKVVFEMNCAFTKRGRETLG